LSTKSGSASKPEAKDFPALYRSADQQSLTGQRRFKASMRLRLGGLLVAALGGVIASFPEARWGGAALALVALLAAVGAEFYTLLARPDRIWYEGRAAAESAKTLAWRYMVRGEGFESGGDVDAKFRDEIVGLLTDLEHVPAADEDSAQITQEMRDVRALSFDERRTYYREFRLKDQLNWYAKNAKFNNHRVHQWTVATVVLEFLGLLAAALLMADAIGFDAVGLVSALAAAATAWAQSRQYQTLSSAYSVTSQELSTVLAQVDDLRDEPVWGRFVGEAEEAISREHTLWRASRGIRIGGR
jgi:hypothetical protein